PIIISSSSISGYYRAGGDYYGSSYQSHYPVYYAFPDDTAGQPIDFEALLGLVTSVKDRPEYKIQLYPNPVQDRLFLSGLPEDWQEPELRIYDAIGRLRWSGSWAETGVSIHLLPRGVYQVDLIHGGQVMVRRRFLKE
ncbi:MAG: T9SS type A sorting domain-containing protein, partial [Bacteroidota bacterium]